MVSQTLFSLVVLALSVVSAQAGDSLNHGSLAARGAHHRHIADELAQRDGDESDLEKRQWWKSLIPSLPTIPTAPSVPDGCRKTYIPGAPGVTGAATCAVTVATNDIDNPKTGLIVGTTNNWANGRIPPNLRGIFYLAGDPYAAECVSQGTAEYNASQGSIDNLLFRPRTWSSDDRSNQLAYNTGFGIMFQSICYAVATNNGRLHCDTWEYHYLDNTQNYRGDYTVDEIGTNHFIRGSSVRGVKGVDTTVAVPGTNMSSSRYYYNFYRIVDETGKRTPYWDSVYLANIGRTVGVDGQPYIHLGQYQEVPH